MIVNSPGRSSSMWMTRAYAVFAALAVAREELR
jgi:hypothetical protein